MGTLNKTSERFTNAVTKLYNAFHKGELKAMDCAKCAVGNMCDGSMMWAASKERRFPLYRNMNNEANYVIKQTGYSAKELMNIERIFMNGIDKEGNVYYDHCRDYKSQDSDFIGLCAVVEYLCELEGIPNVMDYTCLFETENNEPKYKLENVLS